MLCDFYLWILRCPTEITVLSNRAEEFKKLNCQVTGASVDSDFCHLALINARRKQEDCGLWTSPSLRSQAHHRQDYGVLEADEGSSFKGLFIIDDKGIFHQVTINNLPVGRSVDEILRLGLFIINDKGNLGQVTINHLPVGRSVDEILRLVPVFQFTDKHGAVCAAGWTPGSDAIKPDVQKSKEYFSKQK